MPAKPSQKPLSPARRVDYREPFDWRAFLDFLAPRLIAGVETIEGDRYYRVIELSGKAVVLEVGHDDRKENLEVIVHGGEPAALDDAERLTRRFFDLDAPVADIARSLSRDSLLAPLLDSMPGIRVPGGWSGFEIAVRAVLGQQISVKAATTLAGRVADRYGESVSIESPVGRRVSRMFPAPGRLSRARFNNMGIVGARIATLKRLSAAVADGTLSIDADASTADVIDRLCALKGIGPWTGQYVAMRALKDPNAFPESDLGLLNALYADRKATPAELKARAEAWRPWRAYAALLIWNRGTVSGG